MERKLEERSYLKELPQDYSSFLICNHKDIVCFYKMGIEVAIFHKKTKQVKFPENQKLEDVLGYRKDFLNLIFTLSAVDNKFMIDLDELLTGNPTLEQIRDFYKNGEFHDEKYAVQSIKKHLRSQEDKEILFDLDLSIEEILNGEYTIEQEKQIQPIYDRWNEILGFNYFGG